MALPSSVLSAGMWLKQMHLSSVVSGRGHNTLECLWLARRLPSWALERYIRCSDNVRSVLSLVLFIVLAIPKQRNTSWLATCVTIPTCGGHNILCYKAADLHVHALFWDLHMPIHMLNIHLNTHSSSPQALVSRVCACRQVSCI